jgi:xanthine dehydrogenase accessory factor
VPSYPARPAGSPGRTTVEEELAHRLARGEEVVLATVIKLDGEPPSRPGAKLLMSSTAAIAGTLGCSEFDSAALADAALVARSGAPQLRTYSHDLGSIEVYLEPYTATPVLVVFAATPIAKALLRWAPEVGFRPVLVETRTERMAGAEWPEAVTSLDSLPEALAGDVYAVHTDHDADDLVQSLEVLLPAHPRFIGLVCSGRHTGHHLEALRAKGVPDDVIARIQTPVGLDIGARTPPEIALSILAGLVAVRRGARGGWKQGSTNR